MNPNLNSDFAHITGVSGYRLITSPEAITLIGLWIDCHRQNWLTPKSEQYVKEYQGPQHDILQQLLRDGNFPPDISKITQTEQPDTRSQSKSGGRDKPKPEAEGRSR
jgi:hypothetical protein